MAPQLGAITERCVECLGDFGLEPNLLVKAGADIRQQHQLGFLFAGLEAGLAVSRERFGQEALSVRRLAEAQRGAEAHRLVMIEMVIVVKDVKKAGELAANFLKDFLIAAGHGIARACESCGRIKCSKNCLPGQLSLQLCTGAFEVARDALQRS